MAKPKNGSYYCIFSYSRSEVIERVFLFPRKCSRLLFLYESWEVHLLGGGAAHCGGAQWAGPNFKIPPKIRLKSRFFENRELYWSNFHPNSNLGRETCSRLLFLYESWEVHLLGGAAHCGGAQLDLVSKSRQKFDSKRLWTWQIILQEVPAFCDFWFQRVIMKCRDGEFLGLFLENLKMGPKKF